MLPFSCVPTPIFKTGFGDQRGSNWQSSQLDFIRSEIGTLGAASGGLAKPGERDRDRGQQQAAGVASRRRSRVAARVAEAPRPSQSVYRQVQG